MKWEQAVFWVGIDRKLEGALRRKYALCLVAPTDCWNRQEARRSIKTSRPGCAIGGVRSLTVGIDRKLEGALRQIVRGISEYKPKLLE